MLKFAVTSGCGMLGTAATCTPTKKATKRDYAGARVRGVVPCDRSGR